MKTFKKFFIILLLLAFWWVVLPYLFFKYIYNHKSLNKIKTDLKAVKDDSLTEDEKLTIAYLSGS